MSKRIKKRWVLRWHRRAGVVSALVLLLLSVTGFLLNHSQTFGLASKKLSRATASWLYTHEDISLTGQRLEGGWLYQLDTAAIYLGTQPLQACDSPLVGALQLAPFLFVVCEHSLHVYDGEFQLQESLNARVGYPAPVTAIANCDGLCLNTSTGTQQYNFESGRFIPFGSTLQWLKLQPLPKNIAAAAPSAFSWQRLLLDVHAGRFMGSWGVWILDVFVLLFVLLSVSGIFLWIKQGRSCAKTPRPEP